MSVVEVERPTPLAFPLLVDRAREQVSSEKLGDRIRRMVAALERAADGRASPGGPPRIPARRDDDIMLIRRRRGPCSSSPSARSSGRARAPSIVADVHWGKAAAFRAAGIPIPGGTTGADLARLDAALRRTGARRLVVLGDLFHARAGRVASRTLAELSGWRERANKLEILLVRGNHDRHAGDPPADLRVNCVNAPAFLPPFVLRHEPGLPWRLHPRRSRPPGRRPDRPRPPAGAAALLPVRPRMAVLPAFGSFTGRAGLRRAGRAGVRRRRR